ncbi:MAG TPA: D-alanyl-D-alanine carboxypeptidase [Actinomadura sp.]|jgi:D-alanyl-D-alanine carboxypeptidase (penicillin-binding protein 5/6)|nr:D-alanyl-D-alanine carboxypeptidase [Actinomadura sp.]
MGTVRQAIALITVQLIMSLTICPAAGAATGPPAGEPVGAARLRGRGVMANDAPGVKAPPKIDASSYLIADGDTGEVLAAKDPHGHYLPASALKTLTSVALIPKLDRNSLVRPTEGAVDVEGTKVGMSTKLTYRVSDLFKALLMVSGNDAALALTQASGGLRRTLDTMNSEARRLQAYDTLAGSPNGLDVDLGLSVKTQHTSAYDLSLIMRQGLKLSDFCEYVGTVNADWPALPSEKELKSGKRTGGYPIYTHDRLLRPGESRYPGMIGGKNGYTNAAQQTFVGAARRNGHTIIVALMHSPVLWAYATELLDWGFSARGRVQPVGRLVEPIPPVKKKPRQDAADLPSISLERKDAGTWGLIFVAAGAGSAVTIGAVMLVLVLRRRRRLQESPAEVVPVPVEEPAESDERIEPPTR